MSKVIDILIGAAVCIAGFAAILTACTLLGHFLLTFEWIAECFDPPIPSPLLQNMFVGLIAAVGTVYVFVLFFLMGKLFEMLGKSLRWKFQK